MPAEDSAEEGQQKKRIKGINFYIAENGTNLSAGEK
jgi:hypothetical protein